MSRSLLLFESAIKSEETRKYYKWTLDQFLKFTKLKDHDALLTIKDSEMQIMLEDYLFQLRARMSPNSIPVRFASLELFFSMNDRVLNWKKIRKMYPAKIKKSGTKAYSNKQISKMLESTSEHRNRFLIHFLASTGARIGAVTGLKIKHLKEMPLDCTGVLIYPGEPEEYWSFLTPEATNSMRDYFDNRRNDGEYLNENSPVFRTQYGVGIAKVKACTKRAAAEIIERALNRAQIDRVKTGNRFDIMKDHGFRKRFDTIMKNNKNGNLSLKEKLMSHSTKTIPLDTVYHDADVMVLFDEFKLHIAELTINNVEKERLEKEKALSENAELQEDKQMMKDFKQELDDVKAKQERHSVKNAEEKKALEAKIAELEDRLNGKS